MNMTLGRYNLTAELGRGGFGTVYRATDTALDVERALKVLHPALVADSTFIARFKQEAQFAARLEHPNLVPVYDFGEDEGRYFLAMRFMPGGSLKELLAREGRLEEDRAFDIMRQITRGIGYAHDRGIIHRDLKPGNILFEEDGAARVSDLGFAKAFSLANSASLSATGGMIGTPSYMAPEIWRGKPALPASDIYSLGCILYEMLTGEVLFDGESPADVMTKHVLDGPHMKVGLPASITALISKALAKEPEERFKSAQEFTKAIEQVGLVAPPPPEAVRIASAEEQAPVGEAGSQTPAVSAASVPPPVSNPDPPPGRGAGTRKVFYLLGGAALLALLVAAIAGGWFTPRHAYTPTGAPLVSQPTRTTVPPTPAAIKTQVSTVDGMVMVYVPAGEFTMGSPAGEGDSDERPQHTVYLDAYWIDQTEVTNAMFAQCVAAGKCAKPDVISSFTRDSYYGNSKYDNYPVINVNWIQASHYCQWAERKLPTEAQWEKAARGTDSRKFPWGNTAPTSERANFYSNVGDTVAVGSHPAGASPYGALDMAGNVWEWVADWKGDYPSGSVTNPTGPTSGNYKVLRGGSWDVYSKFLRAALRGRHDPSVSDVNGGFRCSSPLH